MGVPLSSGCSAFLSMAEAPRCVWKQRMLNHQDVLFRMIWCVSVIFLGSPNSRGLGSRVRASTDHNKKMASATPLPIKYQRPIAVHHMS